MVDETSEIPGAVPDPARPKRPPPTIDLAPTSSETRPAPADTAAAPDSSEAAAAPDESVVEAEPISANTPWGQPSVQDSSTEQPVAASAVDAATAQAPPGTPPEGPSSHASPSQPSTPASKSISPWVIAPFSGAVAAALVIGVGWMLGWPPVQPPSAEPQFSTVVDGLNARIAGLETRFETRLGKTDTTTAALDKALASARADLASLRTQADKTMAAVNDAKGSDAKTSDVKTAPRDGAGAVDIAALTARIDQIERASRSQSAALAQDNRTIADAKPADDTPLRRVIAAALLDVAVRHGDAYAAALATAKSLAPNPDALKPLDHFASSGVPNPAVLTRDLLTIVPKLAPPPVDVTTGNSFIDRLQSAKLVRIERTDGAGTDRGAVVARITAAALRNDFTEARRELAALPPADRAAAQAWLDKADRRDAALAASRQFADESMTALAKPSQ